MQCRGCGVELDPGQQQTDVAVDPALRAALKEVQHNGGTCPLCGRFKDVPFWRRRRVLVGLLKVSLLIGTVVEIAFYVSRSTERSAAAHSALEYMTANATVVQLLGKPIRIEGIVKGDVRHDETGWKEAKLTIPVRGPSSAAIAYVVGGKDAGAWAFSTFQVDIGSLHKKIDLLSGKIIEYDPGGYIDIHTQMAVSPELANTVAAAPRFDGEFPCVFASVEEAGAAPHFGKCAMPTTHSGAVDRFEVDLRSGTFLLRQSDLHLSDVFDVPLTRSYNSHDWMHRNPIHAFGRNSNHPYDIAPIGTRNPYTFQMLVLEDGGFIFFDRISKGTGYADAVYQHTETSTPFYKATQRWNGSGWTMRLADGSEIIFPESYNAKNMAQGAPTEFRDTMGNRLELRRDGQRNLEEIRTPHGHWIKFGYDALSRITHAEDDAGHWARYEYNAKGMLSHAVLSSGGGRHYEYQGTLMTEIKDEKGRVLLHNWYNSGYLIGQQFGNGAVYSYSYDWAPNRYYPDKVVVTSPDHTQRQVQVADSVPEFIKNYDKYRQAEAQSELRSGIVSVFIPLMALVGFGTVVLVKLAVRPPTEAGKKRLRTCLRFILVQCLFINVFAFAAVKHLLPLRWLGIVATANFICSFLIMWGALKRTNPFRTNVALGAVAVGPPSRSFGERAAASPHTPADGSAAT